VATNVAMMLEGLQGRAAEEVTALFRLQAKEVRQQLRRGFKMIFDTFGVRLKSFIKDLYVNTIKHIIYYLRSPSWESLQKKISCGRKQSGRIGHIIMLII